MNLQPSLVHWLEIYDPLCLRRICAWHTIMALVKDAVSIDYSMQFYCIIKYLIQIFWQGALCSHFKASDSGCQETNWEISFQPRVAPSFYSVKSDDA